MGLGRLNWTLEFLCKGLKKVEEERGRERRNEIKKGCVIMWAVSLPLNFTSASKP
jgi:ASC-1-like (ASCH) protein